MRSEEKIDEESEEFLDTGERIEENFARPSYPSKIVFLSVRIRKIYKQNKYVKTYFPSVYYINYKGYSVQNLQRLNLVKLLFLMIIIGTY